MELKTNAFRARFAPEANNFVSLEMCIRDS